MYLTLSQIKESHLKINENDHDSCSGCHETPIFHAQTPGGGSYILECNQGTIALSATSMMEEGIENLEELANKYKDELFEIKEEVYGNICSGWRDAVLHGLLTE